MALIVWSDDPLATVAQADGYAAARGWADWAALSSDRKSAALLDASTWIKAVWSAPQVMTEARETQIQAATIEAARLTLTGALLGGDRDAAIKSERIDVISTEYEVTPARVARQDRLGLVSAILRSAGARGGFGANAQLMKA